MAVDSTAEKNITSKQQTGESNPDRDVSNTEPASANTLARASDELNWSSFAFELELQSIARQVVLNSVVHSYQQDKLVLAVEEDLQVMLKAEIQQQICCAIESKLGVSLNLSFVALPELSCETPHQSDIRLQEQHRQQAIQQIYADPVVQQLQKTFSAQLVENSVRKQTSSSEPRTSLQK